MRTLWQKWQVIAGKIGDFQATVLFSLLYFLLVTPVGLVSSWFNDFLGSKKFPQWQKILDNASTLRKMEKQ